MPNQDTAKGYRQPDIKVTRLDSQVVGIMPTPGRKMTPVRSSRNLDLPNEDNTVTSSNAPVIEATFSKNQPESAD